jgi:hypothetical protein
MYHPADSFSETHARQVMELGRRAGQAEQIDRRMGCDVGDRVVQPGFWVACWMLSMRSLLLARGASFPLTNPTTL